MLCIPGIDSVHANILGIDSVHANILGLDSGYAIYSWNRQCACYVVLG